MHEDFTARMNRLVKQVLVIAGSSADARDLVPVLNELVTHVRENPDDEHAATEAFLDLLAEPPGELVLGVPGAVEVLEYSMHQLRWPAVHAALSDLADSAPDWRVHRAAERVLEAYEDPWPAGDIYGVSPERR